MRSFGIFYRLSFNLLFSKLFIFSFSWRHLKTLLLERNPIRALPVELGEYHSNKMEGGFKCVEVPRACDEVERHGQKDKAARCSKSLSQSICYSSSHRDKTLWPKQLTREKAHSSKVHSRQEPESVRKWWILVFTPLSPFSTVQDPSPGNGAAHSGGGGVFRLHLTLPQYCHPRACPEGCLQVPYRSQACSQVEELTVTCVVCAKTRLSFACGHSLTEPGHTTLHAAITWLCLPGGPVHPWVPTALFQCPPLDLISVPEWVRGTIHSLVCSFSAADEAGHVLLYSISFCSPLSWSI